MRNRKRLYWICQITGWSVYVTVIVIATFLQAEEAQMAIDGEMITNFISIVVLGISITHLYRYFIIRLGWLDLNVLQLIPRAVVGAAVCSVLITVLMNGARSVLYGKDFFLIAEILDLFLNYAIILFFWSLLYFSFHFVDNLRKEEIKNLQWEASRNEIELNNLKAQLNPHFMFNAMNSIRALIDDDPEDAKDAVTQLANILRNGLLLGKKKLVSLQNEMDIVTDYLSLEKIRYEERLKVEYDLEEGSLKCLIPPLMIQTIVENGIKHGISNLPKGGLIRIGVSIQKELLRIRIVNTGKYSPNGKSKSGIGLKNTQKRLELLYGDKASFMIYNDGDAQVITEVQLPLQFEGEKLEKAEK